MRFSRLNVLIGCLLPLFSSCSKLHNTIDDKILVCGPETADIPYSQLLRPNAEGWQGVVQTPDGFRRLQSTSRGCAIVPEGGQVFVRNNLKPEGISLLSQELQGVRPLRLALNNSVRGLQPNTLALSCGALESQGLTLPLTRNSQPSPLLHLYELHYTLKQGSQILMNGHSLIDNIPEWSVPLPKILAEGHYQLTLQLHEVFDEEYGQIQGEAIDCPLHIDRQPPVVKGFVEVLLPLGSENLLEVAPGQALNLAVEDAGPAQIFYCLAPEGTVCEDFSLLTGSLYAPNQGVFRLHYFTRDAAGNESPRATLAPMAVVHRETMQGIQNSLSLARLEAARGHTMEADRILLSAYWAFYQLTLPIEQEPLRMNLATTYSEIGRGQYLRSAWHDHKAPVQRLESARKAIFSLDSDGQLVKRGEDGTRLDRFEGVADLLIDANRELIVFKDGRFQERMPGNLGLSDVKKISASTDGQQLLVSHATQISLLQKDGNAYRTLWTSPADDDVEAMAFSDDGDAIIAGGHSLRRFSRTDGTAMKRYNWNQDCRFATWEKTSRGFFVGLKSVGFAEAISKDEFHCELLQWDGVEEPAPLNAARIMDPRFDFDPTLFLWEEVEVMAYDAGRQWLFLGRNLDGRFIIYDLIQDRAEIYDGGYPGQPTAMELSADGKSLAISWSGDSLLCVWAMEPGMDALQFPYMEPRFQWKTLPGRVRNLAFSADQNAVLTMDEARELRSYNLNSPMIPVVQHELQEHYRADQGAGILRLWNGKIEELDSYGQILQSWPLPTETSLVRLVKSTDAVLAIDNLGQIWSHPHKAGSWTLVLSAEANTRDFFISNSGQRGLLLTSNTESQSEILVVTRDAYRWAITARVQADAVLAAWNADDTRFALATGRDQSLWMVDGRILVKNAPAKRTAVPMGYPYQPFSENGHRWLVRQDQTLRVYDAELEEWTDTRIVLPAIPGLVRFAGNDALLLAESRSAGAGQFLLERNLLGAVTREYGEIPGALRQMFRVNDQTLGITMSGRVLQWDSEGLVSAPLITESSAVNGYLQEYQSQDQILVVETRPQSLSFLYLRDDRRQLTNLCQWLLPTLTAATDARSQELRTVCLQQ